MLDAKLFVNAIAMLEEEKNIPATVVKEALEEALEKAYQREFDPEATVRVEINLEEAIIRLFHVKTVKEVVEDELTEIDLKKAQKANKELKDGDTIENEVDLDADFGRLAALQVKQVVRQKIREAEKEMIFTEFEALKDEMMEGLVERIETAYAVVAIRNTFGFLPANQIPFGLNLELGDRVQVTISDINRESKGAPVLVSMNTPTIVKRLIENAVPEVHNGTVVIKKIARYSGLRTKIAVVSHEDGLDPVGAIIGEGGDRIKPIITELNGEFIDVFEYTEDKIELIVKALAPAKVLGVKLVTENEVEKAIAIVKDDVFTLAIGKKGTNAKVASRLCGMNIDIKSESDAKAQGIEYVLNGNATPVAKPRKEFKSFKKKDDFANFDFTPKFNDDEGKEEFASYEHMFGDDEFDKTEGTKPLEKIEETGTELYEAEEDAAEEKFEDVDYDAYDEYYDN